MKVRYVPGFKSTFGTWEWGTSVHSEIRPASFPYWVLGYYNLGWWNHED